VRATLLFNILIRRHDGDGREHRAGARLNTRPRLAPRMKPPPRSLPLRRQEEEQPLGEPCQRREQERRRERKRSAIARLRRKSWGSPRALRRRDASS
jgi:hypothetical protein